ncbi:MAG: thioredoxin domain-containing protein [Deltaproteobacteria bacterium]|nr:thioredoxin domain-containing protein [Deltaproteobacteria bacterium]
MRSKRCLLGLPTLLLALVAACDGGSKADSKGVVASGSAAASPSATPKASLKLEGIDTSSMTTREVQLWSELVGSQLAPCKEVAVPLAQCVAEKRDCKTCKPAAEFLTRQVQGGLPKEDIVASYEARFMPDKVKAIVIGDSATRGPADAPVTVVEYADFECPSCGNAYPLLEALYAQFEGKVRFVFKNFPLPSHPNANLAAQAAVAAQKQGQFWRMHHVLFENQQRLTEPDLLGYAQNAGLDMGKFKTELHAPEGKARIEAEFKQGDELGVDATPTIFINGRHCELSKLGNVGKELDLWIRLELELAGVKYEPPVVASATPSGSAQPAAPAASAAPSSSAASKAVPTAHSAH